VKESAPPGEPLESCNVEGLRNPRFQVRARGPLPRDSEKCPSFLCARRSRVLHFISRRHFVDARGETRWRQRARGARPR
jgi:hypothetical protein